MIETDTFLLVSNHRPLLRPLKTQTADNSARIEACKVQDQGVTIYYSKKRRIVAPRYASKKSEEFKKCSSYFGRPLEHGSEW